MVDNFFPVFIDLRGKRCLIIGAGNIAYRKAETLQRYGAKINVVAREVSEKKILELKGIDIEEREFKKEDLKGAFLVVAATDNQEFNRKIYTLCEKENILVNNITSKVEMNTRFAAIYENELVQIAVSSRGNPNISLEIRNKIKDMIEEKD